MDRPSYVIDGQNLPLVLLTFLQGEPSQSEYNAALVALKRNLSLNVYRLINCDEEEGIECDGYMSYESVAPDFADIRPDVNLNGNDADAAGVQQVAADLREIAALFENNLVARATQNLHRGFDTSPYEQWTQHLSQEVAKAVRGGLGFQDLPQERVIVAFGLTLVKGVCEVAPHMLQRVFGVALQFIRHRSGRR